MCQVHPRVQVRQVARGAPAFFERAAASRRHGGEGPSFRTVLGLGDGVFELSGGHCQKIDYTCAGDEHFISLEGGGSLPVYKEPAAVPVVAAAAAAASSSVSSSSISPLARSPLAAAPAASRKRQHGSLS